MTHILQDLTLEMEGQPRKKEVSWVLGIYIYICYVYNHPSLVSFCCHLSPPTKTKISSDHQDDGLRGGSQAPASRATSFWKEVFRMPSQVYFGYIQRGYTQKTNLVPEKKHIIQKGM